MNQLKYVLIVLIFSNCGAKNELTKLGQHYQKQKDLKSLTQAVDLMPKDITTTQVKRILGEPIDNGFDFRYLTDSISTNQCPVGAVFNIDSKGKITNKWVDEICE